MAQCRKVSGGIIALSLVMPGLQQHRNGEEGDRASPRGLRDVDTHFHLGSTGPFPLTRPKAPGEEGFGHRRPQALRRCHHTPLSLPASLPLSPVFWW